MTRTLWRTVALLPMLALPALAQDGVLFDYADGGALDFANPELWSEVAAKVGKGLTISGEVSGSFTAPGAEEIAYLVSNGDIVAAEPFPDVEQRIVMFADGQQVADWALPEGSAYDRPMTAVDVDGDGVSEILLEGSFYNMGTMAVGVDLVKVGEAPEIMQSLPEVYVDSCEAGVGETSIRSSAISVADGQLVAEPTTLECPG